MSTDKNAKVNTPAQMVTPIQPITDDLPKGAPPRVSDAAAEGGMSQEEAAAAMKTADSGNTPPAAGRK